MIVEESFESYENGDVIYEYVKLEDFDFEEDIKTFFYPCPCGDIFEITLDALLKGETICRCPSCSLRIKVVYQRDDLKKYMSA